MPLRSAAFWALLWLLCSSSASVSPTAPLLTSNSRGFSLFSIQFSTFVLPTSSSATCTKCLSFRVSSLKTLFVACLEAGASHADCYLPAASLHKRHHGDDIYLYHILYEVGMNIPFVT